MTPPWGAWRAPPRLAPKRSAAVRRAQRAALAWPLRASRRARGACGPPRRSSRQAADLCQAALVRADALARQDGATPKRRATTRCGGFSRSRGKKTRCACWCKPRLARTRCSALGGASTPTSPVRRSEPSRSSSRCTCFSAWPRSGRCSTSGKCWRGSWRAAGSPYAAYSWSSPVIFRHLLQKELTQVALRPDF